MNSGRLALLGGTVSNWCMTTKLVAGRVKEALPLNTKVNSKESQDLSKWLTLLEQSSEYLITLDSAEGWPIGIVDDLCDAGGPWQHSESQLGTTEETTHRLENDSELQGNDILCYPLCTMESICPGFARI